MAAGVLYTYPENFRAYKALIAAKYSGADVKVAQDFVFGETNKSADFLKKFPLGKVPAFESADGKVCLSESNAIAYYVSNAALRGSDEKTQALVWMWASWADAELLPAACAWLFPYLGIMQFNKLNVERAKNDLLNSLKVLDQHLLTRTFIVGERVSLADIIVFTTLLHPFQNVVDSEILSSLVNVSRWFRTTSQQPQVKSVIGEVNYCQAPPVYDPLKYQVNKSGLKYKKESGDKKKDKKQEKKPQSKPEAKPQNDEAAGDDEPSAPQDSSSFNMDEFKRCYSNEEETVSIPFFWQKFDPQEYSIWYAEYKYPEELAKVFMSCNLITGMFQRLDKLRKTAFASVCLFGSDNDSSISGVWVWKGQELAFLSSPDLQVDYESYDWKKLDPASEETKKLVNQYFSWTGEDANGRKFNQGKVFK